jgi:hypothetical protein
MQPAPAHQNISPSAINERNVKILLRSGITAPILRSGSMRVESFQDYFTQKSDGRHAEVQSFLTRSGSYCSPYSGYSIVIKSPGRVF